MEGGGDAILLAQAVQQPPGQHGLIAHLQGAHRPDLELPLAGHHLSIGARDAEASGDARFQVILNKRPAVDTLRTHAAVERTLQQQERSECTKLHTSVY